jgi:PST family polysaccharide transporter
MFDLFKRIFNNEDYKRLIDNTLSLFSLQGLNYILPLITFPYLTRVLGPDNYGLIAFSTAFIGYFQILSDYGFNFSATKEISTNRYNKDNISKIFSSVMITKLLLVILSFIVMTLIVFSFNKFRSDWLLYYFTFGLIIGNLLLPTWFFQGLEKMRYISILNIGATIIFTISIFLFVHKSSDYLYVPLINSIGTIIVGIIALRVIFKDFKVKLIIPSLKDIKHQINEGWHVFISTLSISQYTIANIFILGFFATPTIVGYYSVADKIIKTASGLFTPISQSTYPYICNLVTKSETDALNFIKRIVIILGIFSFVISLLILLLASPILSILAGNQYNQSVLLIQIMAFLPFIIALSNVFGIQTMLTFNLKKQFSKIYLMAAIINIILIFVLAPIYKDVGVSIVVVITETFVTIAMFLYLKKAGINIFSYN